MGFLLPLTSLLCAHLTLLAFNYVAAHDVEWGEIPIRHLGSDRVDGDSWRDQYVRSTLMYTSFQFDFFLEDI